MIVSDRVNELEIERASGERVMCPNPVLEAGHREVQQVQQPVDLHHRQVRHPLLQEARVGVLQHPQETHQQGAAALGRQGAGLPPGLVVVVVRGRHTHQSHC